MHLNRHSNVLPQIVLNVKICVPIIIMPHDVCPVGQINEFYCTFACMVI